ncbi:MAG TPA: peptidyl-prolyl cis-trans isomerase [Candidatus Cryosericum sp.]|nr:peptidyl-prolyl cis-trans isomerase [Candidatus Cryosericum sp.]
MKNFKWKQMLAALLAVTLMLSVAGCALKDDTTSAATSSNASSGDAADDQVAVKIGDKYTITKGEIADQYDYMVQMYSAYGMSAPTEASEIESMQDSVIATLVSAKIQLYEADKLGITLTGEEKATVESQVEEEMKYYMDNFKSQAESEGATDVDARTLEIFQEQLDAAGMEMDVDGFRAYVLEQYTNDALTAALKAKITEGITATEDEIQAYYDENLASQKETYDATPTDYLSAAESAQSGSGDPVLYAPAGYVRVRSISITPTATLSEDYTTLKTDMDTLAAQYGAAALEALAAKYAAQGTNPATASFDVAASDIEGYTDLLTQYLAKKSQADAMYEEYIKDARAKATEAYAALESGTSFADAMAKYGEDTMYTATPSFVDTGILMYLAGTDTAWDAKLTEAVGLLKAGEYSPVIQIDDMFYILQLVGDEPSGEKTLADTHDAIMKTLIASKGETLWNDTLTGWEGDKTIVTYFEDVYRSIGK